MDRNFLSIGCKGTIILLALAKNGSFAKLGLWVGWCGFANVPFVRWQKNKKMRVGQKLNLFLSGRVSSKSLYSPFLSSLSI
jgi:hypothetical protein